MVDCNCPRCKGKTRLETTDLLTAALQQDI
jgi:hypothetical protein